MILSARDIFGVLLFASASNDGKDVDAEDCFFVCWEEAWWTPCENGGVICVGGIDNLMLNNSDPRSKASGSNYGLEEVDIFAPYYVWVGPDPDDPGDAQQVPGTSFSSPFAAGVAGLIWAANPGLSTSQVENILLRNAFSSPDSLVNRYVNAYDAVIEALGGNAPPSISIRSPVDGSSLLQGSDIIFRASVSDREDPSPTVTWISDQVSGLLGQGSTFTLLQNNLPLGTHMITVTVTDSGGFNDSDSISITILPDTDRDGISDGDEINIGTDPNNPETDGDGLIDGDELALGANPLDRDSDNDGLTDGEEVHTTGTNPTNQDTDGDGFQDSAEVFLGSDPISDTDIPTEIPIGTLFGQVDGNLAIIDTTSGAIGLLGQPNNGLDFGLAFDELATLFIAGGSTLRTYEPLTGTTTDVGTFVDLNGIQISIIRISYSPTDRMLYGAEEGTGQLVVIDRSTARVTKIGTPLSERINALAHYQDGRLFASLEESSTSDQLWEIDPVSGSVLQNIGLLGVTPVDGMAFDRNDILFASNQLSNDESQLMFVDVATGQATARAMVNGVLSDLAVMPCPEPCLTPSPNSPFVLDGFSSDIAISDLNGDGNLDLVTVTYFPSATWPPSGDERLSGVVLLGDGAGGVTRTTDISLPTYDYGRVVIGDLNMDLIPDLAFAVGTEVHVFLGNGDGSFSTSPNSPFTSNVSVSDIAIGDLNVNNDNYPDLITVGTDFSSCAVIGTNSSCPTRGSVLLGNGAGDFALATEIPLPNLSSSGAVQHRVVIDDLNGDFIADLVFGINFAQAIHVFSGDGGGNFLTYTGSPFDIGGATNTLNDVAVADLTGDGIMDLVTETYILTDPNTYIGAFPATAVLLGNSTGGFDPPNYIPVSVTWDLDANSVAIGDLTGDGNPDVVTSHFGEQVAVLVGDGRGGFIASRSSPFDVGYGPMSVAIGDLNSDGLLDVITANFEGGDITLLLSESPF